MNKNLSKKFLDLTRKISQLFYFILRARHPELLKVNSGFLLTVIDLEFLDTDILDDFQQRYNF